jgi:hypothetical protein
MDLKKLDKFSEWIKPEGWISLSRITDIKLCMFDDDHITIITAPITYATHLNVCNQLRFVSTVNFSRFQQ